MTKKKTNKNKYFSKILVIIFTCIVIIIISTLIVIFLKSNKEDKKVSGPCPPGQELAWDGGAPDENGNFNEHCYTKQELKNREGESLKPVIILYSDKDIEFSIKQNFNIKNATIYPNYNGLNRTWQGKLSAEKDEITINDNKYSYLFWEGDTHKKYNIEQGNIVKKENLQMFLENALNSFGLNYREKQDFITFWLPKMQKNDYSLVSFTNDEYDQSHPMEITPKPDYIKRVFMVFKKSNPSANIVKQDFSSNPEPEYKRHGFSLIEWGGQEL